MTRYPPLASRGMLGARSIKPYAEYVDTLNDFGKKGGEYGLKVGACPAQGLREKVGELWKRRLTSRLACLMESPFGKVFGGKFWVPGKSAAKKLEGEEGILTSSPTLIFLGKNSVRPNQIKNNKERWGFEGEEMKGRKISLSVLFDSHSGTLRLR